MQRLDSACGSCDNNGLLGAPVRSPTNAFKTSSQQEIHVVRFATSLVHLGTQYIGMRTLLVITYWNCKLFGPGYGGEGDESIKTPPRLVFAILCITPRWRTRFSC